MPIADQRGTISRGTGEILDVLGPYIQHLTVLSDSADGYCLIRSVFPDGAVVPVHSHVDRESFYILEGVLQAFQNGRWITLACGDVHDIPGGTRHAFRNVSGGPVRLLIATTMRMGRFLRDIGRPAATVVPGAPGPAELRRLSEIAEAYGYWLGNAAENAAIGIPPERRVSC